jgi:hypothetical protein
MDVSNHAQSTGVGDVTHIKSDLSRRGNRKTRHTGRAMSPFREKGRMASEEEMRTIESKALILGSKTKYNAR